jgi:uncharacterized CHY-type Zn-finger protein
MNHKTIKIKGKLVDDQTRCVHYQSELDIIAIKFKCCNTYYPCFSCHEEDTNHLSQVWRKEEFDALAILCGACEKELSIQEYMESQAICPYCQAHFNPKCSNHYHLYFEME